MRPSEGALYLLQIRHCNGHMVEAADAVEGLLQSECASGQMRRTGGVVAFLRAGAVRRSAGLGRLATLLTGRGQARRSMGRFEENGWFLRTPIHMRRFRARLLLGPVASSLGLLCNSKFVHGTLAPKVRHILPHCSPIVRAFP